MQEYKRKNTKFITTGMYWGSPSDIIPEGKVLLLQNVRISQDGVIESRPKLDIIGNLKDNSGDNVTDLVHSIKRIIDLSSNLNTYVVGAGDSLYSGNTNILFLEDGFSGKPLSLIDFRPEKSLSSYCYVGDENKLRKVSVSGDISDWGIEGPRKVAIAKIDKPFRKIIDDLNATTGWVNAGNAGAISTSIRINDDILAFIPDDTSYPCYITIIPSNFSASMQEGCIVSITDSITEDVIIEKVLKNKSVFGISKIKSIKYDDTVSNIGRCTINLDVAVSNLNVNDILNIGSGEYVRIEEVIKGEGVDNSFVCTTTATKVVNDSIEGVNAFRAYISQSPTNGDTLSTLAIKSTISASGLSTFSKVINIDLTNTGATNGRPLGKNDVLHFSTLFSDFSKIEEIQILLDCDIATNDYTKNYFLKVLTGNDLTTLIKQTINLLPVQQSALQREEIRRQQEILNRQAYRNYDVYGEISSYRDDVLDEFSPTDITNTGQITLGDSQWNEFFISLGDFTRVGSDASRTFKDIKAIRFSFKTTSGVDIYLDAIWVGGGNELNNNTDGLAYNYIWRLRDPNTGEISNWSAPMRNGLIAYRNRILLTAPDANTDYDANFKITWARFGGQVADFRILGEINNNGNSFEDEYSDTTLAQNPKAYRFTEKLRVGDADFYKPFPLLDKPKNGVCNVVGNKVVWVSGDKFNINWAIGNQIIIDSVITRLYNYPTDDENLEVERDLGSRDNVNFYLPEPLLVNQPLPIIAGPFGQGNSGLILGAIGDINAAGTFYWTDGNNPSTASDLNKLEITSPSEPLMALVLYDGLFYVWSTERSYTIYPSNANNVFGFVARENANSKGLFGKYAITVGDDGIYYLTYDGIDVVEGTGNPVSITDNSFRNFFNVNGLKTTTIKLIDNIDETIEIVSPDFTKPDEFRLRFCNGLLFLRFIDLESNYVALVYDTRLKGWISYDTYKNDNIGVHYAIEGESQYEILAGLEGKIASFTNQTNYENGLYSYLVLGFDDFGDVRLNKLFSDIFLDVNSGLNGFNYSIFYNNGKSNEIINQIVVANGNKRDVKYLTINEGNGFEARNIATYFKFLIESGTKFYNYEPSFIPKPEISTNRPFDLDDSGDISNKWNQGITLKCDTFGVDKILKFVGDDNYEIDTITINHTNEETKSYAFKVPHICHSIKMITNDSVEWKYITHKYQYDKEPELAKIWHTQDSSHQQIGLFHLFKLLLDIKSFDIVTLKLYLDGINTEDDNYKIESTNGLHKKIELFVNPKNTFLVSYRLESEKDFAIYKNNCEVWIKSFSSSNNYEVKNPFGEMSNLVGALV